MSAFLVSCRKEWLEQWRNYRVLVLTIVLVLFGVLSPVSAKYTPEIIKLLPNGAAIAKAIPPPVIADAVGQYLKNVSQFGVILALLLTMGSVAQEKDKGTAAMILVKPLSRRTFVLAKFTVLALLFAVTMALAGGAAFYYTWLLFGALDPLPWIALNGLMLAFVLVYVAITLFFSVLAKSQAGAGGLAFLVLASLGILGSVPLVGDYLPASLLSWAGGLMAGHPAARWPALGVTTLLVVLLVAGAGWILERQEL
jgi:ABC-2 type transport system permease protein